MSLLNKEFFFKTYFFRHKKVRMLRSKGILPPLILDCSVRCALVSLKKLIWEIVQK